MPNSIYLGDENGIAQNAPKPYIGDENGIAQKVVKVYIGDENGIAQLCFTETLAQVVLTGMSAQHYCVIDGKTYDSGDYTLELELGTPIDLYFKETQGCITQLYVNRSADSTNNALLNCYWFRYVVSGDATIACVTTNNGINTFKKAVVTESEDVTDCFAMQTTWSTGETTRDAHSFRGGMTWGQFVGSMYNNGDFMLSADGTRVCHQTIGSPVLLPDSDMTSGDPVALTDRITMRTYL